MCIGFLYENYQEQSYAVVYSCCKNTLNTTIQGLV